MISSEEVREAIAEPVAAIVDAIKSTLDKTPPELASDIMDRGIMMAGGGSLLRGMCERVREETQMPVNLAESPLTCVAVGSGRSLEEFDTLHRRSQRVKKTPLLASEVDMPRNKVAWRRVVFVVLIIASLAVLTVSFRETESGPVHAVQQARPGCSLPCSPGAPASPSPSRTAMRG